MKEKIIDLREKGFSYIRIIEELGCSKGTVSYNCSKLKNNSDIIRNNKDISNLKQTKYKSFVNDINIEKILSLINEGKTVREIISITGYNKYIIYKVRKQFDIRKNKQIKKDRICRNCSDILLKSKKIICDKCRMEYYSYYRPSCEFNFNPYDYKDKFDINLLEKYGWYSPSNKNNNLLGVSKDHLYSVKDGFLNVIDPSIIKHPANCKLMLHKDNNSKGYKSIITLDELLDRIKKW